MIISKHGSKRIKQRIGLPKRAHLRHIQQVLKFGQKVTKTTQDGFKIIHNGFLYIFAHLDNNDPILVTTYEEPNDCTKLANVRTNIYK